MIKILPGISVCPIKSISGLAAAEKLLIMNPATVCKNESIVALLTSLATILADKNTLNEAFSSGEFRVAKRARPIYEDNFTLALL